MAMNGVVADEQFFSDRLVGETGGDEPQNLELASGQAAVVACARLRRRCGDDRRDSGELCECRPRDLQLAGRRLGTYEQFETRRSIRSILHRYATKVSIDVLGGRPHVAAIERQLGATEQR